MGACIGKKNSKYLKKKKVQSDTIKPPQIVIQDDTEEKKSSPTPSNKLPVINGSVGEHNDDYRLSKIDGDSINSELRDIIEEQKIINEVLRQPFTTRVVSVTDTELELELVELAFQNLEDKPADATATNATST